MWFVQRTGKHDQSLGNANKQRMCLDVEEKKARVIFEMKEVNRQVVMCVLDKIEKDGTKEFLPYLEAWKMLEVKKVAARIAEVEKKISKRI